MDVERVTGKIMADLFPDGRASAAGLAGLYWIARRRADPTFTWEQAREVRVQEFGAWAARAGKTGG